MVMLTPKGFLVMAFVARMAVRRASGEGWAERGGRGERSGSAELDSKEGGVMQEVQRRADRRSAASMMRRDAADEGQRRKRLGEGKRRARPKLTQGGEQSQSSCFADCTREIGDSNPLHTSLWYKRPV